MHGSHAIGKQCEDKGLRTNPSCGKYTMVRYTAVICKVADLEGGGGGLRRRVALVKGYLSITAMRDLYSQGWAKLVSNLTFSKRKAMVFSKN